MSKHERTEEGGRAEGERLAEEARVRPPYNNRALELARALRASLARERELENLYENMGWNHLYARSLTLSAEARAEKAERRLEVAVGALENEVIARLAQRLVEDLEAIEATRILAVYELDARLVARCYLNARQALAEVGGEAA